MTYPKIVVWDLFGGGQNSVYEALKDNSVYDIYTFDVTKPLVISNMFWTCHKTIF